MSNATYAFVFNGSGDWRVADDNDWDLELIEIKDEEKKMGHRKIDGSICKIMQSKDGMLYGLTKQS